MFLLVTKSLYFIEATGKLNKCRYWALGIQSMNPLMPIKVLFYIHLCHMQKLGKAQQVRSFTLAPLCITQFSLTSAVFHRLQRKWEDGNEIVNIAKTTEMKWTVSKRLKTAPARTLREGPDGGAISWLGRRVYVARYSAAGGAGSGEIGQMEVLRVDYGSMGIQQNIKKSMKNALQRGVQKFSNNEA